MDVTAILSRLAGVKKTPKGWLAKCPAHQDRSPSLFVSLRNDESIGVYCFAGCQTHDVVAAIGLSMADLYADSPNESNYRSPARPRMTHADALRLLSAEAGTLLLMIADLLDGKLPNEDAYERACTAGHRINAALEFIENGQ